MVATAYFEALPEWACTRELLGQRMHHEATGTNLYIFGNELENKTLEEMVTRFKRHLSSIEETWKFIMTGKCDSNSLVAVLLNAWKRPLVHNGQPVEAIRLASVGVVNQDAKEKDRLFVFPKAAKYPKEVPDPKSIPEQDIDRCFQTKRHRIVLFQLKDASKLVLDLSCAQYGLYPKFANLAAPILLAPLDDSTYISSVDIDSLVDPEEWYQSLVEEQNGHSESIYLSVLRRLYKSLSAYTSVICQ